MNLPNNQIDECLDAYNICRRSALRAMSEWKLTSYQRKKWYRDEIFATMKTSNKEKILSCITQIQEVIKMVHKTWEIQGRLF